TGRKHSRKVRWHILGVMKAAEPASSPGPQTRSATASGPAPELLLTVAEIGRELAAPGELDERLARALLVLERRLSAQRSVLYIVDAAQRSLQVCAAHGISAEQFRPRYGSGVAGRVIESAQPIIVPVVRHDPMALSEFAELPRWSEPGWNLIAV